MLSGGYVKPATVGQADVNAFVNHLSNYKPTSSSYKALEKSAKAIGINIDGLRASSELKALGSSKRSLSASAARFADKAPSLYPDRAPVLAFGLLALEKMGFQVAGDAAAEWFHKVAKDLGIDLGVV